MSAALEAAVRDYLRGKTAVMGLLNNEPNRLNMDWNGNVNATHVTLYRSGGGYEDYVPFDVAAITFHCYGSTRIAAAEVADAVAKEMRSLVSGPLNASVDARSASVESVSYLPTSDGTPRYVVTTVVTAIIGPIAA